MKKSIACFIIIAAFLAACSSVPSQGGISTPIVITAEASTVIPDGSGTVSPVATPGPPTAIPTLTSGASTTELKYRVLTQFPDFFFCDPDYYPIAREDESVLAEQNFPDIQTNTEEFQAILAHNNLSGTTSFTNEQKLLIYREHKKLNAIYFELSGDKYKFQIQTGTEGQQGTVVTATIDSNGSIAVLQKDQSFPSCPICLAAGTLIDTPRGAVRVEELRVGDSVWTTNDAGERVSAVLLETGSVRVTASHQVIHVTLSDGRELWASPGHPTADGRALGNLKIGDPLDGAQITQFERVHYSGVFTFDILPSGRTGYYWANGEGRCDPSAAARVNLGERRPHIATVVAVVAAIVFARDLLDESGPRLRLGRTRQCRCLMWRQGGSDEQASGCGDTQGSSGHAHFLLRIRSVPPVLPSSYNTNVAEARQFDRHAP